MSASPSAPDTTPCPNCRAPMQSRDLERRDAGRVRIDLCHACTGIWFDHLESSQLAPAAVVGLFREIQSQPGAAQPAAGRMQCPRCEAALALTQDLGKGGRFSYFRCPAGDGRFTPFFQFLREKQFVRSLTPGEIAQVRAQVREVRCSGCGAPVDLEHDTLCRYCRTPVSILDADAVEKAMQMWTQAEANRRPAVAADDVSALPVPRPPAVASPPSGESFTAIRHLLVHADTARDAGAWVPDLIALGVSAIAALLVGSE